jgi:hypothetical protein
MAVAIRVRAVEVQRCWVLVRWRPVFIKHEPVPQTVHSQKRFFLTLIDKMS